MKNCALPPRVKPAVAETGRGGDAFRPFCVGANREERVMGLRPRNAAATATLTATRPTAFTGRKWVRWTQRMKAEFLDNLAGSCNVKASAEAIGVNVISVYALRRRDAEFALNWQIALASGYQLLETLVLGHVLSGASRDAGIETPHNAGTLDMDTALRLLSAHRNAAGKPSDTAGPPRRRSDMAETDAAILKKLSAIEKRRGAA